MALSLLPSEEGGTRGVSTKVLVLRIGCRDTMPNPSSCPNYARTGVGTQHVRT